MICRGKAKNEELKRKSGEVCDDICNAAKDERILRKKKN